MKKELLKKLLKAGYRSCVDSDSITSRAAFLCPKIFWMVWLIKNTQKGCDDTTK
nr:MAG TPA: hypothetical protein [Caudoviricetes sp.]